MKFYSLVRDLLRYSSLLDVFLVRDMGLLNVVATKYI